LYASELQNRLDKMKEQRGEYSQKKGNAKIKEDIESSRKLLSMKRGELKSLEEEIGKLRLSLNLDKRMGHTDMLETIL
jgi:HAMP domain-containing protein